MVRFRHLQRGVGGPVLPRLSASQLVLPAASAADDVAARLPALHAGLSPVVRARHGALPRGGERRGATARAPVHAGGRTGRVDQHLRRAKRLSDRGADDRRPRRARAASGPGRHLLRPPHHQAAARRAHPADARADRPMARDPRRRLDGCRPCGRDRPAVRLRHLARILPSGDAAAERDPHRRPGHLHHHDADRLHECAHRASSARHRLGAADRNVDRRGGGGRLDLLAAARSRALGGAPGDGELSRHALRLQLRHGGVRLGDRIAAREGRRVSRRPAGARGVDAAGHGDGDGPVRDPRLGPGAGRFCRAPRMAAQGGGARPRKGNGPAGGCGAGGLPAI